MEYEIAQEIWNLIYPIGSVYMSKNLTDPSTLFGGTWQRIKGRVIVGVDEDDEDFKTPLKTGGSKKLQKHNHYGIYGHDGNERVGSYGTGDVHTGNINEMGIARWEQLHTGDTGEGDSGNLQPYIALYIWMRIE